MSEFGRIQSFDAETRTRLKFVTGSRATIRAKQEAEIRRLIEKNRRESREAWSRFKLWLRDLGEIARQLDWNMVAGAFVVVFALAAMVGGILAGLWFGVR